MAKKKVNKPRREVTKRQLSRWQQQKKRQRIILGTGIFIIVAVVAIVGAGWYLSEYQPRHQTAIRVNDTEFNMDYYIKMLKLYGGGMSSTYLPAMADEVVRNIEQNELIRQEAQKLGVSVSNREVDEELKSGNSSLSKDYRDVVRADLVRKKILEGHFDEQVPLSAEQRHLMAMLLESKSQAADVRARILGGEEFGNLAGELSLESLSMAENGDLGWHPQHVFAELLNTSALGDFAFGAEIGVLSQPVFDEEVSKNVGFWLAEVLDEKEESGEVRVQTILLGSQEEAEKVRARLVAGDNFTALAKELTQLVYARESGGDLGWITPGMLTTDLEEFVFNTEVGTLSEPIRDEAVMTTGGYWLIKVVDKEDNKEISEDDRDLLKGKALSEWISALWDNPENEVDHSYLDEQKKAWAIEKALAD